MPRPPASRTVQESRSKRDRRARGEKAKQQGSRTPPPPEAPPPPRGTFDSIFAHLVLPTLSAVMLLFAYPQPGWWWLAHLALVPMSVLAIRSQRRWRVVLWAYIVGFAWWLYAVRWLTPITGGGYVALAAYLGIYWPLALVALRMLYQRCRLPAVLALPLAWVSFEFVRGIALAGGFAWFALGHTQAPYLPEHSAVRVALIQVSDLGGEWTVSFLVAMTNGAIVDLILRCWRIRSAKAPVAKAEAPKAVDMSALPPQLRPPAEEVAAAAARPSLTPKLDRTPPANEAPLSGATGGWPAWVSVLIASAVIGLTLAYGQFRVGESADHKSLATWPIAVVQTDVPQSNKIDPTDKARDRDWQRMQAMIREASHLDPAPVLIITPETMTPGPINEEAASLYRDKALEWSTVNPADLENRSDAPALRQWAAELGIPFEKLPANRAAYYQEQAGYRTTLSAIARETKTHLLIGSPTSFYEPERRRANSVYHVRPDGQYAAARYDKVHRVPFGEYVPWVERWPKVKDWVIKNMTPYDFDYTLMPGETLTVFDIDRPDEMLGRVEAAKAAPLRVATPICFEDVVARFSRKLVYDDDGSKRADVLVNVTNDGWFVGSDEPWQHMQMATLRAVENRVPMIRSVNGGVSGFIDSTGRVRKLLTVGGRHVQVDGVAAHAVAIDDRVTIFGQVGQWPIVVLCGVTGALLVIGFIRGRPVHRR